MRLLVEQSTEIRDFKTELFEAEYNGTKRVHQKISGVFMSAEQKNRNGRIYPREVLEHAVGEYQEFIEEKSSWGAIDHPPHLELKLKEASHLITKLEMAGNDVWGEATLLDDTENGRIVKNAIQIAGKCGVSSRGAGELRESNGQYYVCDGFKLLTVDFVARPSAREAFTNMSENYVFENGMFIKKDFNMKYYESFLINLRKALKVNAK